MAEEPSVFMRIIRGEIPAHKVYEDEATIAFLDINPIKQGHTLVVPKAQVDHIEDLPDEDYQALMAAVKKVAQRMREQLKPERVGIWVEGFEVPHCHVHLIPLNYEDRVHLEPRSRGEAPNDELAAMADRLRF